MLHRTATASQQKSSVEIVRLSDYVTRTRLQHRKLRRQKDSAIKQEHARERSWKRPPNKHPRLAADLVMRIRKLRWVGLEEKAEQLEKELEQCAVTDRVSPDTK